MRRRMTNIFIEMMTTNITSLLKTVFENVKMENDSICQFCLQKTSYYDITDKVDGIIKMFLPFKKNNIEKSTICSVCTTNLQSAYRFTQTSNGNNSKVLDATLENDDEICQTCLKPIAEPHVFLYDHTDNVAPFTAIQKMLKYCLINLDLAYRQNPVMCDLCWDILKLSYRFLVRCAHIEGKIIRFCNENGIAFVGTEDLEKLSEYNICFTRTYSETSLLDISRNSLIENLHSRSDVAPDDIFNEIKVEIQERAIGGTVKVEDTDSGAGQFHNDVTEVVFLPDNARTPINDIVFVKLEPLDVDEDDAEPTAVNDSDTCDSIIGEGDTKKLYIKLDRISLQKGSEGERKDSCKRAKSTKEQYNCHLCKYTSRKLYTFKHHLTTHMTWEECAESNMLFQCSKCTYRSKRKYGLAQHMRRTHKTSNFVCQKCTYETDQEDTFKHHLRTKHDVKGKPGQPRHPNIISTSDKIILKCGECEFETKIYSKLEKHALSHKNPRTVKLYKCEVCGYQVKKWSGITRHVVTHSSKKELSRCDKLFRCEVCSFKTKRKDYLGLHMKKHENDKPQEESAGSETVVKVFNLRARVRK